MLNATGFPGTSIPDTSLGVDSLCTCMMRQSRSSNEETNVMRCLEIDGAMPVYVLHYAGIIPSADYVLWAFLSITASCLNSFSRMQGYPNLRIGLRWILPLWAGIMNFIVFALNFWVWSEDSDGFETADNMEDRRKDPDTCATVRFIFAFIIVGYTLHIPHLLQMLNVPCWQIGDGVLMQGYSKADTKLEEFRMSRFNRRPEENQRDPVGSDAIEFRQLWTDKEGDDTEHSYDHMQSNIYASELNQRDVQFRVGFWQAVSEDLSFTTGAMLLAAVFSAHAGVHDDSTLLVDVCCVGGVGLLQHMAHVLMLVKEYVLQNTNEDTKGIGNDDEMDEDMEATVCHFIGNTRVMIHFFVFALVVFYCNRASPSTYADSELTNFFEVARFSVVLTLLACNTMYDVFFEAVHVLKHMREAGPGFEVNAAVYAETLRYPAKEGFLAYHAQYRGPYLWRVHLLLPFMLFFGAVVYCQQHMRGVLNIDARVGLV
jgi:hypothetical protein